MTLAEEKLCSGCSACADVCPKGAIKMTPDREGFPRPAVDNSLCIECGACENICPQSIDIRERLKKLAKM